MPDYTPNVLDHFTSPTGAGALESAELVGGGGIPRPQHIPSPDLAGPTRTS